MLILANSALLLVSLLSVLFGTITALPLAAAYGVAIASLAGNQKPVFYKMAIAVNGLHCLLGLAFLAGLFIMGTGNSEPGLKVVLGVGAFIALTLVPALNVIHIFSARLRAGAESVADRESVALNPKRD